MPALAAGHAVVAAVGEVQVGLGSSCSGRRARRRVTPAARSSRRDHRAQVEHAARRPRRRTSGERLEHLLARPRSSSAPIPGPTAAAGGSLEALERLLDDAAGERRASRSGASPPARRPTSATGKQSATRTSRPRPASRVMWPSTLLEIAAAGIARSRDRAAARPSRGCPCRAPASPSRPLGVDADASAASRAVLAHAVRLVVGEDARG